MYYLCLYYFFLTRKCFLLVKVYVSGTAKDGDRECLTHIYYLLRGEDFSRLHKLNIDEIWHYYAGTSPIQLDVIHSDGKEEFIFYFNFGPEYLKYNRRGIFCHFWKLKGNWNI